LDEAQNVDPLEATVAALQKDAADRDYLVVSDEVGRELHERLTRVLNDQRKRDKCTLFLTTLGGDPHGGYRLARCLRHHYKHVRLVVPSRCKSAGTLIAICADELAIGDLGELGPLDIQVSKPSEFLERSSGLDIVQALNQVLQHAQMAFRQTLMDIRMGGRLSTRLAGEFASKVAVGIVEPLYAQIDPNRLGEMQRAMQITHEYGERLDGHSSNLKEGSLDKLVAGYPSHSFVIDRKEARELFRRVGPPSRAEADLCNILWRQLSTETGFGPLLLNPHMDTSKGAANDGHRDQDQGEVQPADPAAQ
jgi:hypothetical protein